MTSVSVTVLAAIAAITGQSKSSARNAFRVETEANPDTAPADSTDIAHFVERVCTRVGIAPALNREERQAQLAALRSLTTVQVASVTRGDLHAWDRLLRHTPMSVPTLDRTPVDLPPMPGHQEMLWQTLMELESVDEAPWVLVGGQMVSLHLAERGVTAHRPTDDGDVVVGVWTRRDALERTASFLRGKGFSEVTTSDGYGYRYVLGKTSIDVMIPEGLDRQRTYPTTGTGRPGFAAVGGNQALARAERVPVTVAGVTGYMRRPNLLGAIVAKSWAWVCDSRDSERHAQDLAALGVLALDDPRAVVEQATNDDRKVVRKALRRLPAHHRVFRAAEDPAAVHALLARIAEPPQQ